MKALTLAGLTSQGATFKNKQITLEEVPLKLAECRTAWLDIVVEDVSNAIHDVVKQLGFNIEPSTLLGGYLSNYEDLGETLALMIPIITFRGGDVIPSPLIIFVKKDRIFLVHEPSTGILRLTDYADTFLKRLPKSEDAWADRNTLMIGRLLDEIIEHNFAILRQVIERAEELQIKLGELRQLPRALSVELSTVKRAMMTFLNVTWATHETVHSLRYGDPEMISDKEKVLAKFEMILASLDRQIEMAEHILEVLTAGMNVVQTEVANRLATILLWLTVVGTAVLVPNTLATVYSFLPFAEQQWPLLLTSIIVSTVISTIIAYWYVWRWWHGPTRSFVRKLVKTTFRRSSTVS